MDDGHTTGPSEPIAAGEGTDGSGALRIRVFTGPTLSHQDAGAVLPHAELRPPITVADLPEALADGVDVVAIIDGAFVQSYSANPTQLIECLRSGMAIYGAASAGVLRAVETERFGMRGIGQIFALFKAGYQAEDELLMSYDPDTLEALTVPMINVRYALDNAVAATVITPDDRVALGRVAKSQYFAQRTYRSIATDARRSMPRETVDRFQTFVAEKGDDLDLKRLDALVCLREIDRWTASLRIAA